MGDMIKVCDLWRRERRGASGEAKPSYLVGAAGGLRLLIFDRHDAPADGPHATLFVAERPPKPTRDAERGNATQDAMRDIADTWTREQRDAHVQQLAAKFQPDEEPPF